MSVLTHVFDSVSSFTHSNFISVADQVLPAVLFENVLLHELLRERADRVKVMLGDHPEHSRNPEIYLAVARLNLADGLMEQSQHLTSLELQLGLTPVAALAAGVSGYFRLVDTNGQVWAADHRGIRPLDYQPWSEIDGFTPRAYLPFDRLFEDFVPTSLYPRVHSCDSPQRFISQVGGALSQISRYDDSLLEDLSRVVSWVVLTPDFGDSKRWSYSFRLGFFTGVFVNAYRCNEYGLAEGLIHEYYHLRLWQWWYFEPLVGLPDEDRTIVSPVSERTRSVAVMTQALLIYIELIRYYAWSLCDDRADKEGFRGTRLKTLGSALPSLLEQLTRYAPEDSSFERLLGVASAEWEETKRAYL
jgi:hypothetical protein